MEIPPFGLIKALITQTFASTQQQHELQFLLQRPRIIPAVAAA